MLVKENIWIRKMFVKEDENVSFSFFYPRPVIPGTILHGQDVGVCQKNILMNNNFLFLIVEKCIHKNTLFITCLGRQTIKEGEGGKGKGKIRTSEFKWLKGGLGLVLSRVYITQEG